MKRDLMQILCCPDCKGDLELKAEKEDAVEVLEGSLYCKKCDETYVIKDGIPDLVSPKSK